MRFMRSLDLSKNFLTALTDLVLTVRGSVSNEYPALGIPALQSGWSEWSKCGFTEVAETPEEYFEMLQEHIDGLHRREGPDHPRAGRAGAALGLVLPLRQRRPLRAGAAVAGR